MVYQHLERGTTRAYISIDLIDPISRVWRTITGCRYTSMLLCWHIRTNRVPNIRIYSDKFYISEYSVYSDTLNRLARYLWDSAGIVRSYGTGTLQQAWRRWKKRAARADRSQDRKIMRVAIAKPVDKTDLLRLPAMDTVWESSIIYIKMKNDAQKS